MADRAAEIMTPDQGPLHLFSVILPLRDEEGCIAAMAKRNRRAGATRLKIKEMGSGSLFRRLYLWPGKFFSWGDDRNCETASEAAALPADPIPTVADSRSRQTVGPWFSIHLRTKT